MPRLSHSFVMHRTILYLIKFSGPEQNILTVTHLGTNPPMTIESKASGK